MKHIHFPTLAIHVGILILAALTINQYHDAFLFLGVIALIAHIIWAFRSRKLLGISHLIGCAAEFLVFSLGLINVHNGAFGLGGGEFALIFYEIALGISAIIEAVILAVKLTWKR